MNELVNVSFEDFIEKASLTDVFEEDFFVLAFNSRYRRPRKQIMPPVRFNAVTFLLCTNGELSLSIDYKEYLLKRNMLLWLNSLHIIGNIVPNDYFEGYVIILSPQFANSIFSERKEEVIRKFIRLLLTHCKEHHDVSFYANELCMTAGNLSRITKAYSGKRTIKWINDVLITESKILLRKSNNSIQQVADELHFVDQSSFGKFFRKHIGLTPREYRKNVQK